jgi:predicted NAD-dependent protein-ADP-ribosyltransferase YbiA (DUF1768 family)
MKSEVYKEKVNTRDELVACIMNSAALIKQESKDDLRRATRTTAKRVEVEVRWGDMDWIYLAQDRERRWALVNAVMNFRVP